MGTTLYFVILSVYVSTFTVESYINEHLFDNISSQIVWTALYENTSNICTSSSHSRVFKNANSVQA